MTSRLAHEPDTVDASRLHRLAALLFAAFIAIAFAMYWLRLALDTSARISIAALPQPPRLQAHPADDLASREAQDQRLLNSYAWIDRDKGIARIPVKRAMILLVSQHKASSARGSGP